MNHNCDHHGYWMKKHMTPLGLFDPAFPEGQGMTDVDAIIERRGQFLLFECKKPGVPIPKGQEIMLKHLSRVPQFTAGVLWGDFAQGQVTQRQWFTDGKPEVVHAVTLDDVIRDYRAWWWSANENGFPVVAGDGVKMVDKHTWTRAVDTLEGWRRYSKQKDANRVARIIQRNQDEAAQGVVPLPPDDEEQIGRATREYSGKYHMPPDLLDYITVETYLSRHDEPGLRAYLKHKPRSRYMNRAWTSQHAKFADALGKMFNAIGVVHER